jgi:hypothetical protein
MVTQCQNQLNQHKTTKLMISRCTPAPAASSTATARAAPVTAKPARPRKRTPNPAAVQPAPSRPLTSTGAAMGHGVSKNTSNLFLKKEIPLNIHAYPPGSPRTAGVIHGDKWPAGAGDNGAGIPQLFWSGSNPLRRMYQNPTFFCFYPVVRIENCRNATSPYRIIRKYLVQERPVRKNSRSTDVMEFEQQTR